MVAGLESTAKPCPVWRERIYGIAAAAIVVIEAIVLHGIDQRVADEPRTPHAVAIIHWPTALLARTVLARAVQVSPLV